MVIIVDTREQKPFTFSCVQPAPVVRTATLTTGDYSLEGYESRICVERKSAEDLFSSMGNGRERFEREIERMSEFDYAAVVVEADWSTLIKNPPAMSQMLPKAVFATVVAWEQRYRVSFWMCPNRHFAERATYRILERFYNDHNDK